MCGRFTLALPADALARLLDLNRDLDRELADEAVSRPRFNIAPGQDILAAVRGRSGGDRDLLRFNWGLVPSWAKVSSIGNRMINARAETLAEKPAFREALVSRRCLIPADGFYEWKRSAGRVRPWYFRMKDAGGFTMAGLWERWRKPDGGDLDSCTIITTVANRLIGEIHPRMPAILDRDAGAQWLSPDPLSADRVRDLLGPFDPEKMTADPVGPRVNDVGVDDPDCRRPAPEIVDPQRELF